MLRARFVLPEVSAVAAVPRNAVAGEIIKLAALTQAMGARLAQDRPGEDGNGTDAATEAETIELLKLKSARWLRSADGKRLRCPNRVGGRWMYSRHKIAAFLRGELE